MYEHAKRELEIAGLTENDSDYNGLIAEAVLELAKVFDKQGHSGMSANLTADLFSKLAKHETISPLTGEDYEWDDISRYSDDSNSPRYQNNRNSAVFKNGKDGQAYYIDAIVFSGDEGGAFTSGGSVKTKDGKTVLSRQKIKSFPFQPKTFYVDVKDHRWADKSETTLDPNGDWWTHTLEDESQLDKIKEYYDFEFDQL